MRRALYAFYKYVIRALWKTGIGNVQPFNRLHYLIVARLRPREVEYDGHRFLLDPTDTCRLSYARTNDFEAAFLLRQIRGGQTVVDVGANIGYYTLVFARAVGPSGHVFAFEPEPGNFDLLHQNIGRNGYENVTSEPKAISDVSGTTALFLSNTHGGAHRVYASKECANSVEVAVTTLDDYFQEAACRIALVKVDTEGAEPLVLKGMQESLRLNPGIRLFLEFNPAGLVEQGTPPDDFLQMLRDAGFKVYHVDSDSRTVELANLSNLLKTCPPTSNLVTNLWCIRED